MKNKNLLLKEATVLYNNKKFIKTNILIENKIIKKINKNINTNNLKIIDCSKYIIIPALINSHYHLGETIYRGKSNIKSLKDYLNYTSKKQKMFSNKDYEIISKFSIIQAIKNGVSIISCARNWKEVKDSKLKGALGYPLMNSEKLKEFKKDFENKFNIIYKKYNSIEENKQIIVNLWIHSLNKIEKRDLIKAKEILKKNKNITLSIHISETKKQVNEFIKKNKITEIQYLDKLKLLNNKINLVHCNHISNEDFDLIKSRKANITICPISNLILNTGLPNLKKILKKKINVAIGTDGLSTNYSASPLESLKQTILLYKDLDLDYKKMFNLITINSAKILNFEKCGIIKENYSADLYFIKKENLLSSNYLYEIIINSMKPEILMINGKIIFNNEKFLTMNYKKIKLKFEKLQKKLDKF